MAENLPVLDVTARDFIALEDVLTKRAIIRFPNLPQTDFNKSGFMSMMVDLFAGVGDGANFYIDNIAQDLFWESVRDRDNAIRLGKLIGFTFNAAESSLVSVTFTISKPTAGDVVIPARTQILTNSPDNPLIFETLAEAIIPAGQTSVDADAENAELKSEIFTSNGQPNQTYTVQNVPFVQGSSSVVISGDVWEAVEDFFNSKTTDKHFIPSVDGDDRLTAIFGDGEQGAVPIGEVEVIYKTGGGSDGNVFANTIVKLDRSFTDEFSNPVTMITTNLSAATGGADRESIAEARFRAPRSVKTNERTVAREDFEINAQEVNGVSRAKVFTSDDNALIPENTGFLYLVPVGGGAPTATLKDEVFDYLTYTKPTILGFVLNVVGASFIQISFTMRVFVKDSSYKEEVHEALQAAFVDYFAETILTGANAGQPNPEMDFEKKFFNSEVACVAQDAHDQLRNVVLDTDLEAVYNLLPEEFPIKGVLVFLDGDTGLPLP